MPTEEGMAWIGYRNFAYIDHRTQRGHRVGRDKTTTVAARAVRLGRRGTRVDAVDMDPHASLSRAFGQTDPADRLYHNFASRASLPVDTLDPICYKYVERADKDNTQDLSRFPSPWGSFQSLPAYPVVSGETRRFCTVRHLFGD